MFSMVVAPCYVPTSSAQGFQIPPPVLASQSVFCSHYNGCEADGVVF